MNSDDKIASTHEIARRANRISIVALALATLISGASLGFSMYRSSKEDQRTEKQDASVVLVESIDSTNTNHDPIFQFGNWSRVPVDEIHAFFYDAEAKKTLNYKVGSLPRCFQIGLLVERRLKFVSIEFTDPDGHSWRRGKEKPVQSVTSVNTSDEIVPEPYDEKKLKPGSYDRHPLQYCL